MNSVKIVTEKCRRKKKLIKIDVIFSWEVYWITFFVKIIAEGVFWKSGPKRIGTLEQLDEGIFRAIESLRNDMKQSNEDTIHAKI